MDWPMRFSTSSYHKGDKCSQSAPGGRGCAMATSWGCALGTLDIIFFNDFWITGLTHVDWLLSLTNQEKASPHCVFSLFFVVYNTFQVITQNLHSQIYEKKSDFNCYSLASFPLKACLCSVFAIKCLSSRTQYVIIFFDYEVNMTSPSQKY